MDEAAVARARRMVNVAVGVLLVVAGVVFLLVDLSGIGVGRYLWPFFVIVPGLAFFPAMVLIGRSGGPMAIPGSIMTVVGLILLYQSSFMAYQTWSYAWALIVVSVGVGMMINGAWSRLPGLRLAGQRVAQVGAVLFLVFGAFFELVLNISGLWSVSRWLWPALLIAAGAYLILRQGLRTRGG